MLIPNSFLNEVFNGVKTNLNSKREDLKKRVKEASNKAKKSSFFNEFVVPAAGSDRTEKALTYLEDKFKGRSKGSAIVKVVRSLQRDIMDHQKVADVSPVEKGGDTEKKEAQKVGKGTEKKVVKRAEKRVAQKVGKKADAVGKGKEEEVKARASSQ